MSLDWAMMFMTEFPKTQKKCQDEIEKVSRFSVLNWYISSTSILNHIPEYTHFIHATESVGLKNMSCVFHMIKYCLTYVFIFYNP